MRLENKVAIVSGSASGMGAATARRFAKEGAKVVVADLLETEGRAVVKQITDAGGIAMFHTLDVTSEASWKAVVDACVAAYGRLDIMVNNAGISGSAVNDLLETGIWDRVMSVNATGAFLGTKFAVEQMQKNGGGSIVNISSTAGLRRWISSMNSTSRGSRLVRMAARSPALASTGPDVERKLTPSSRATICARVVLPRPGGPEKST